MCLNGIGLEPEYPCPDAFFQAHSLYSDASSTANEVQNEDNQGDQEQQMDESAADMKSKTTAPKEQKKNGNN